MKKEELQEAAATLKKLLKCCERPSIICQKRETCKGCSYFLREYERSKALITGINTLEALAPLPDADPPAEVVIKYFDNIQAGAKDPNGSEAVNFYKMAEEAAEATAEEVKRALQEVREKVEALEAETQKQAKEVFAGEALTQAPEDAKDVLLYNSIGRSKGFAEVLDIIDKVYKNY